MPIKKGGPELLVIAPDKFKGTASALEVARWSEEIAKELGQQTVSFAMSDGGEGLLDAIGGEIFEDLVTSPLGREVYAKWSMRDKTAVIEMAKASGLSLVGGAEQNEPMRATTKGTGQLIVKAFQRGAEEVLVGCGGSATIDGGVGALAAMEPLGQFQGVALKALVDTRTKFLDAAKEFGPQKGANEFEVKELTLRLRGVAGRYLAEMGIDVTGVEGTGAAGGLAGGLYAAGARIVSGFDYVSHFFQLESFLQRANGVITGEGQLDSTSFTGKVVGSIAEIAHGLGIECFIIAGRATPEGLSKANALGCRVALLSDSALQPPPRPSEMELLVKNCVKGLLSL